VPWRLQRRSLRVQGTNPAEPPTKQAERRHRSPCGVAVRGGLR
jgi:hypothetical protein